MRTADVELEEEILAMMMRDKGLATFGLKELNETDFVTMHKSISPSKYTNSIFNKIKDDIDSGSDGSATMIISGFKSDPFVSEKNQKSYVTLIKRLSSMKITKMNHSYFKKNCDMLVLVTRKRGMDLLIRDVVMFLKEDNVVKAEDSFKKYLKALNRRAMRTESVIIDWKENFPDRKIKVQEAIPDTNIITGFPPIDDNFGSITRGELHVIVGRTGGGKSVLKQHVTANVVKMGYPVLYITKEDTEEEVALRFDAHFSNIDHPKFHMHMLKQEDLENWEMSVSKIPDNLLKIVCMGQSFNIDDVKAILNNQINGGFNPALVVIDYIGLMEPVDRRLQDYKAVDKVVQDLKEFAIEYNIGVISSAQLRPDAYEKETVEVGDIAASKLGISTNVNGLYAFINTSLMKAQGGATVQVMKVRSTGIKTEFYTVNPNFHRITIHEGWRALRNKYENE